MAEMTIPLTGHDETAMIVWAVQTILNAIAVKLTDHETRTIRQMQHDVERAVATVNRLHDEATAKCPPVDGTCNCDRLDAFTSSVIDAAYRIIHAPHPSVN